MLVETYEVTEIDAEGTPECEAEASELIEKLGLEGQRKLYRENGNQQTRIPYRKMTAEEKFQTALQMIQACKNKATLQTYYKNLTEKEEKSYNEEQMSSLIDTLLKRIDELK